MKNKLNLWLKKTFFYWILKIEDALIEQCHYCNSIRVKVIDSYKEEHIYKAKYKCLSCGAEATVEEIWNGESIYRNGVITPRLEDIKFPNESEG